MEKLNIKHFIDYFKLITRFEFDLYDLLSSLIYARSVNPCSKYRTFHEVLPNLYQTYNFSYDQLLDGLAFLGNNYEKIVEIFTTQVDKIYKLDTTKTYFDCTNFYFEIDREDDFKKNGVSKENQRKPLVGLGLLLDRNQIPVGMKIYPGNESEKPIIRDVISNLKKQNNITGRTIHVADKGLNCANNIAYAKKNGDGYIFSKAVKKLPDKEKKWVLLDRDFKDVKDKWKRYSFILPAKNRVFQKSAMI
jgi:transposase